MSGALAKIGDTFDRLTGRRWIPSSSLATSELIAKIKELLDSEAKQIPGKGAVVPHNIKLKIQWDKFSTDAGGSLKSLENELLIATADHINDSLYYTFAPLNVEVKQDYFIEGVKIFVGYETFAENQSAAEMNVSVPAISLQKAAIETPSAPAAQVEKFIARFELGGSRRDKMLEFPAGGRHSVGRASGSDLMIDHVSVSNIHATLVIGEDRHLSVADTGSSYGTFINGQRISYGKATRLVEGDRVKFGEIEVIFDHVPKQVETEIENPVEEKLEDTISIGGFEFTSRVTPADKTVAVPKEIVPETIISEMPKVTGFETVLVERDEPENDKNG